MSYVRSGILRHRLVGQLNNLFNHIHFVGNEFQLFFDLFAGEFRLLMYAFAQQQIQLLYLIQQSETDVFVVDDC